MRLLVFGIIITAVLTVPLVRGDPGTMRKCWPSNSTMAQCFAALHMKKGLHPSEAKDSYSVSQDEDFDFEDYTVVRVEKDPWDVCGHKDELMRAMRCLETSMEDKCPDLAQRKLHDLDRISLALDTFCKREKELDKACMAKHERTVSTCKEQMETSMNKPDTKGTNSSWKPKRPAPSDFDLSNPLSEPKQDSSSEPESESEPEPKPEWSKDVLEQYMCNSKYKMMGCVKKPLMACRHPTAQIIADLMKSMVSEDCAAKMDRWTAASSGDCEDQQCDGAVNLSAAWVTVTLPAVLVLSFLFRSK